MSAPIVSEAKPSAPVSLSRQITWWVLVLPALLIVALTASSLYLLNFIHVLTGALWTGADLFLGFILGPILRRLAPQTRTAVVRYLVPKTILFMPVIAFTTGTAGWFLASRMGMLAARNPMHTYILAALVIVTILAVQGLAFMLPNNIRVYRELSKAAPDINRIVRLNRYNMAIAASQAVFQVAIIMVMSHLAVG